MRVFFDINVLLDVLAMRRPFYAASALVWTLAEERKITGLVSVLSFPTIYYIVNRMQDRDAAQKAISSVRSVFTPVACNPQILNQAIDADFTDFEDALQYFSALHTKAAHLLTRNPDDFPKTAPLVVAPPNEFLTAQEFE